MGRNMRESLAAVIALEILTQGVFFDSRSLRGTFPRMLITRVLRALINSRVISKSMPRRKYLFTEEFLETMKREITREMPRRLLLHHPDFAIFDLSGIESWTEEEFEGYSQRLRRHWIMRSGRDDGKAGQLGSVTN